MDEWQTILHMLEQQMVMPVLLWLVWQVRQLEKKVGFIEKRLDRIGEVLK